MTLDEIVLQRVTDWLRRSRHGRDDFPCLTCEKDAAELADELLPPLRNAIYIARMPTDYAMEA